MPTVIQRARHFGVSGIDPVKLVPLPMFLQALMSLPKLTSIKSSICDAVDKRLGQIMTWWSAYHGRECVSRYIESVLFQLTVRDVVVPPETAAIVTPQNLLLKHIHPDTRAV